MVDSRSTAGLTPPNEIWATFCGLNVSFGCVLLRESRHSIFGHECSLCLNPPCVVLFHTGAEVCLGMSGATLSTNIPTPSSPCLSVLFRSERLFWQLCACRHASSPPRPLHTYSSAINEKHKWICSVNRENCQLSLQLYTCLCAHAQSH